MKSLAVAHNFFQVIINNAPKTSKDLVSVLSQNLIIIMIKASNNIIFIPQKSLHLLQNSIFLTSFSNVLWFIISVTLIFSCNFSLI